MSTDRPIHREQHQDHHHDCNDTSDRERRYSGNVARLNGHELIAIDEWLPGTDPTPYEIDLTDGCEYRTRYWRFRNCGQERNRRSQFIDHCETPDPPTPLEAARTGIIDHDEAREAGFDPISETITAKSRAGYYPEGGTVTITVTADRETKCVLGASLVSEYGEGAVHRSHAVVAALKEGATVFDLENDDLAYAPPFNSTWDPVLVAAKVLSGKLR